MVERISGSGRIKPEDGGVFEVVKEEYVAIPVEPLMDAGLSLAAKGLLALVYASTNNKVILNNQVTVNLDDLKKYALTDDDTMEAAAYELVKRGLGNPSDIDY